LGGRVHPRIGDRIEPTAELDIEVIEIAECAFQRKAATDSN